MEEGLQNLYCLLRKLQEQGRYREGNIQSVHSAFAKKESGHLIEFSNVLFEELVRQSENLHALLRGILGGVSASDSTAQFTKEGFIWLLRCCLMMLQFLDFDMSFLWEKCGVLFKTLGRIFSQKLVLNSHGCRGVPARNSFLQCRSGFLGGMEEEANQMFNFFSLIFEDCCWQKKCKSPEIKNLQCGASKPSEHMQWREVYQLCSKLSQKSFGVE